MGSDIIPKNAKQSVVQIVVVEFLPTVFGTTAMPKKKTAPTKPIARVLTG